MIYNIMKNISFRKSITMFLAFILSVSLYAQQLTIKGKIIDETDEPLIGGNCFDSRKDSRGICRCEW